MVGWRTSGEDCECNRAGYITNYSQFGRQYGHANVFVDNGPMTYDGLGYTCVYTSDEGVLRSSLASAWTRDMEGWLFIR